MLNKIKSFEDTGYQIQHYKLKKKKIALFANTSWNIVNFRMNLIDVLLKKDIDLYIIMPDDIYSNKLTFGEKNINLIMLKNLKRESINPWQDLKLIFEIRKILLDNNIDLVLTYTIKPNIYTNLSVLFTQIQTIPTVTGLGYTFLTKNVTSYIVQVLYKLAFFRANKVVFQNGDDRELFVKKSLVSNEKTQIIYGSGINTSKHFPINQEKKSKSFQFLFVGRILKDKGIIEFIKASKLIALKYPSTVINILGNIDSNPSGISQNYLNELISDTPNIRYHGHKENIVEWLHSSDIVVLPSYREGLPKVIIEALAVGKPVIVSDAVGCRDTVIDGQNGYLVKVKSVSSLVEAMEKMINSTPALLFEMGNISRKLAIEKFDDKIVIKSYLKIIEELL